MKVEVAAYTTSLVQGVETVEEQVAHFARVSNPSNQVNNDTAPKLIRYLIKNKHWSPFETVSFTLYIETTRDIGRQILRHRSFSFQEFSQRYADPTQMEFHIREARLQDTKNRQNSIIVDDQILSNEWKAVQAKVWMDAAQAYKWAIDHNVAKEQARAVLPEGITMSRLYMAGTLRSWIHYIQLRSGNGTQLEHREIALACADAIAPFFPMMMEFVDAS